MHGLSASDICNILYTVTFCSGWMHYSLILQVYPLKPGRHWHVYLFKWSTHRPLLRHGLDAQSLMSGEIRPSSQQARQKEKKRTPSINLFTMYKVNTRVASEYYNPNTSVSRGWTKVGIEAIKWKRGPPLSRTKMKSTTTPRYRKNYSRLNHLGEVRRKKIAPDVSFLEDALQQQNVESYSLFFHSFSVLVMQRMMNNWYCSIGMQAWGRPEPSSQGWVGLLPEERRSPITT